MEATTTTNRPTITDCEDAVASLNEGGMGMFATVRVLLAHAGLAHDDDAVLAAMKVRKALALLDDDSL